MQKKELEDVDGLTEGKVDKVVEGFLEDVKENLIETNGWPLNFTHPTNEVFDIDPKRDAELKPAVDCLVWLILGVACKCKNIP